MTYKPKQHKSSILNPSKNTKKHQRYKSNKSAKKKPNNVRLPNYFKRPCPTQLSGKQAEDRALKYLQRRNYQCLVRNYRRRCGEIDLIMLDKDILVFVEVRFRSSPYQGHPLETVNSRKTKRLIQTAKLFIQSNPQIRYDNLRFDVIGIKDTWPHGLSHLIDAIHIDIFYLT